MPSLLNPNIQLDDLSAILTKYPALKIEVGGHTDSTGDPAANSTLSQQRADVVKTYLVGQGISAGRIELQLAMARPNRLIQMILTQDVRRTEEQNLELYPTNNRRLCHLHSSMKPMF